MKQFLFYTYIFLVIIYLYYLTIPIIFEIMADEDIYFNGLLTQYQGVLFIVLVFLPAVYGVVTSIIKIRSIMLKVTMSLLYSFLLIFSLCISVFMWAFEYNDPRVEYIDDKKYIVEIEHINFTKFNRHYYEEINWYSMKKIGTNIR
ncbi:hypothetical protein [Gemelliphila palaticanis]|uniref:Uncharacterized protein n=1 Tax=Gemelliphila palaticanis TaxID=81950 RepID=A0ABX2SXV0_9BACL|nr:hypothetical protein [Gemella palaticanis]MBF0715175.1 hypothetical protein [Gemella palaticanis]NYS47105.1 hypothetical protein [Gemella palaticanis]